EDADLAMRVQSAGWELCFGRRAVLHPPRNARWWASVVRQLGNCDDAMMRRLHGPAWRVIAGAPRGRLVQHIETSAALAVALAGAVAGHRRIATMAAAAWAAQSAAFAWSRIAPGSREPGEVAAMAL